MKRSVRKQIVITTDTDEKVREFAKNRNISVNELVNRAVIWYMLLKPGR